MKKTIALLMAIMVFMGIVTAVGCGTVNETTGVTTQTSMTTTATTQTTKESTKETTSERTTATTRITETFDTTDTLIDPTLPLPGLDDPIIDVEPNVPESGTGDNGALGDILDNINNDMRSRKKEITPREKHRKNTASNPMTPTK